MYSLGIDLGTQSLKVIVLCSATSTKVATASASLALISRADGSREQQASWWVEAMDRCMASIDPSILSKVHSIGVSGQQHGFVPLSGDGQVTAPIKLWCDTATEAEVDELHAALGGAQRVAEMTGNRIAVGYTASKIRWLKKQLPDAYEQMAYILLPHDYINFLLTGNVVTEYGDASGTGLLDITERRWSPEVVKAIDGERDLMRCLPTLIEAHDKAGNVHQEAANRWGLPAHTLVSSGGGDNMMAAIGTGNFKDGQLTASMGTSGTLFGFSASAVTDTYNELAAFCSSTGGWLPLLCTMNCTVATEQLRSLFDTPVAQVDALAASIPPGSDGVITLPFYNGERTPALPNGKAVIFGLDTTNCTKAHLYRSAMEAAVFGLKTGLLAFQRQGMSFNEVTLTGGGSSSEVWCQMVADILDLPVKVLSETENAALGAAIQAQWCLEYHEAPKPIAKTAERFLSDEGARLYVPSQDVAALYQHVYERFITVLNRISPLYDL